MDKIKLKLAFFGTLMLLVALISGCNSFDQTPFLGWRWQASAWDDNYLYGMDNSGASQFTADRATAGSLSANIIVNNDPGENPIIVLVTLRDSNLDGLTVARDLPDTVAAGQEFDVIVTFTSPDDGFATIGLTDEAPAGWSASVDITWCDPPANLADIKDTTIAEYLWVGPYGAGQAFTAIYKVRVPTDATPGSYTFSNGQLEYYIGGVGPYTADIIGDSQVVVEGIEIFGVTGEVNCNILPEVAITLYQGAVEMGSTTSDGSGNYALSVPELGDYEVLAGRAGYKEVTQSVSITEQTYPLDFRGEHGLIPNVPNMSYVLRCVNHWLYPYESCGLSMSKVLEVVNAWLYPQ